METSSITVGQQISTYRQKLGWTQKDLSIKSGVAQSRISSLENGKADKKLRIETLQRLAEAMKVPVSSLLAPKFTQTQKRSFSKQKLIDALTESVMDENIMQTFYPPMPATRVNAPYESITSLIEFLVYLPLLDPVILYEIMYAYQGDYVGNEEYLGKKIGSAVSRIPDSDAKRYADWTVQQIRRIRNGESRKTVKKEMTQSFVKADQMVPKLHFDSYIQLLTKRVNNALLMNGIAKEMQKYSGKEPDKAPMKE